RPCRTGRPPRDRAGTRRGSALGRRREGRSGTGAGRSRQGRPVRLRRFGRRAQLVTTSRAPNPVPRRFGAVDWAGVAVLVLLLVVGLSRSKWLPYWDRAWTRSRTPSWAGVPLVEAAAAAVSLAGAWDLTLVYFAPVWKALLVALIVAAALDALVPRDWPLRVRNRSSHTGQSLVGAALSMPSIM